MDKERHVMIAFPHPDDEAFSCSGTISMYAEMGVPVTYVCGTLGEMGRNMGNPPFATRETLRDIRKKELMEAVKVVGIDDLRMLGYRDKTMEFEDLDEIADKISEVIDEVKPSLILTFYPGYSVHPDHDTMGAAVIRAAERIPEAERPQVDCVAFSKNTLEDLGEPDIVRDVTAAADKKIAAIQAHRSQAEGFRNAIGERLKAQEPEAMEWIGTERFWHYKWND
ncbi:bacillithiol biosynthesis deacetylase BshB2 [Bacillus marinisedimentorum]|uniref:bacillithiol biosynthesis deacetylase BshB2 n=1 Tax=Bacillus marinisedimentorum TaxID=1821260 RepID=UPI000872797C|nr:bacillithiol biosynthesis deacetylase BshB2 [Bacillus marinisedimentorum]